MAYSSCLILLSGPIASGKTTLARDLMRLVSAEHVSTSGLLSATVGRELDRGELQRLGLGASFQEGGWIVSAVRQLAGRCPAGSVIVVDAVRTLEQVRELREASSGAWRILHVHLRADDQQLAARHGALQRDKDAWGEVMGSPTEAGTPALETEADVVIDTTRATPTDVAVRVAARIGRTRSA